LTEGEESALSSAHYSEENNNGWEKSWSQSQQFVINYADGTGCNAQGDQYAGYVNRVKGCIIAQ
jgi:hypothetical protein